MKIKGRGFMPALTALIVAASLGCENVFRIADERISCDGEYGGHLQGVATDGTDLFWSFTTRIVRTDMNGKILAVREAPSHQGDLCVKDGVVYVAVNRGRFNQENAAVSEVSSYDAKTLEPLKTWPLPDMTHGAGGMTSKGGRFFVVGGLPATHESNYVYEYTGDFKLVKRHELGTGFTLMGIQTAAYEDGKFFFGIYGGKGNPSGVLEVPEDFSGFKRFIGKGSVGIFKLNGRFYVGEAMKNPGTGGQLGCVKPDEGFCSDSRRYVPKKNGGELRIFFADRDRGRWVDCGYRLRPDGYRPLSRFDRVFLAMDDVKRGKETPAVFLDGKIAWSIPDLVRGVRRAASENESLAICFPGNPDSQAADEKLARTLAAIVCEAELLGVRVVK